MGYCSIPRKVKPSNNENSRKGWFQFSLLVAYSHVFIMLTEVRNHLKSQCGRLEEDARRTWNYELNCFGRGVGFWCVLFCFSYSSIWIFTITTVQIFGDVKGYDYALLHIPVLLLSLTVWEVCRWVIKQLYRHLVAHLCWDAVSSLIILFSLKSRATWICRNRL